MIDNYAEAMKLVKKMEAQLPIPAHPSRELVRVMRQHGVTLKPSQVLEINGVFYMGDEGGISCAITGMGEEKVATITSLTHLLVTAKHPLSEEIRVYQSERTRKLSRMDPGKPGGFSIKPKKKRR